jgi:hypothetical protein
MSRRMYRIGYAMTYDRKLDRFELNRLLKMLQYLSQKIERQLASDDESE